MFNKELLKRIAQAARDGWEELNISGEKLETLPAEVFNIVSLKTLNISGNLLTSLPPEIGQLTNLETLDIGLNRLTSLPAEIGLLTKLNRLLASANKISDLPGEIIKLTNLRMISLSGNPLGNLPKSITQLLNLRELYLLQCQLSTLPPEIGNLQNLKSLRVDKNQLTYLPPEIGKLSQLTGLILSDNQITDFPVEFFQLKRLKWINLQRNKIRSLSEKFKNLSRLKNIDLRENELPIPPEILEKTKEPQAIFDYYFSLIGKPQKPINELKVLFLGQGFVGKTSLVQRLLRNIFDERQKKTYGIAISQWKIDNIALNVWDFGGQEIMHATHQFFLTKRSLYLLVLDSRLTQEENRVEYWLKIIQSFGGESPVLIVGNKIDQHPLDIDRTGLQKKYPNIVGILETSAATGAGIEELKTAITEQVNNLPHVRDLLPETWFTVKTKLEGLGRESNFITHDKYLDLCAENGITDEISSRTLIGFLHDLGVVLHFQDDRHLAELGILNPQWVTNGVYKILNDKALFANKGVLTLSLLDEILSAKEYPPNKRLFIVEMMRKFELCYDIDRDNFLIPDLLPKDEPEFKFNGVPAFEYAYPVLPSSVITRFIVRMNQKIDDALVWRTGVALKIGENKALVKADIEDRKITIAIDGVEYSRRDALSAIRYELGEIHNSIKGLNPQQRVPVPNAPLAEPLKYEYLLKLERAGQETVLVENGNDLVTVNVRQMLSAIETEAQRKEQGGNITNIYVGGNFDGNLTVGDGNQSIKDSYNKVTAAPIDPELKQTLQQLVTAVEAMSKSMPEEQSADVTEDLGRLVDEAVKPKPNQKWYSVSIEGLIKAAENLDKLGTPVISLSRKVLSLLTGGTTS